MGAEINISELMNDNSGEELMHLIDGFLQNEDLKTVAYRLKFALAITLYARTKSLKPKTNRKLIHSKKARTVVRDALLKETTKQLEALMLQFQKAEGIS